MTSFTRFLVPLKPSRPHFIHGFMNACCGPSSANKTMFSREIKMGQNKPLKGEIQIKNKAAKQ